MGSSHISCEFEYFYQLIMTFGDQGTQGDPYGYIKTIKFKIHYKMEVSGRFGAVWPIVWRAAMASLPAKNLPWWPCEQG